MLLCILYRGQRRLWTGLQDANTLEATQSMVESGAVREFLLNDQEVLLRHLHKETAAWIAEYELKTVGV